MMVKCSVANGIYIRAVWIDIFLVQETMLEHESQ